MPAYGRPYSRQEVAAILHESEASPRPYSNPGTNQPVGHSVGLHGDTRDDLTDQREQRVYILGTTIEESRSMDPALGTRVLSTDVKPTESRFTSRKDMILALHQAMNSSVGQTELAKLDTNANLKWAKFVAPLVPPVGNIERFRSATDAAPQTGLSARAMFVYLCRVPGSPGKLHLQTAYPRDVV